MKEFPCLVREAGVELFKERELKAEVIRKVLVKEKKQVRISPSFLKKELYLHLYEKKQEGYKELGIKRSRGEIARELGIEERWLYNLLREKKRGKEKA